MAKNIVYIYDNKIDMQILIMESYSPRELCSAAR